MQAIGERVGLSAASVFHRLRDVGVITRTRVKRQPDPRLASWVAAGLGPNAIARFIGCSDTLIRQWLRAENLKAKDQRGHSSGPSHPSWKGGRTRPSGYVMLWRPDHPNADKRGRVMEHRLVMEQMLGRFLRPEEIVHHMNHIRDDNRRENLMLLPNQAAHMSEHHPKGKAIAEGGNEVRWGQSPRGT